MTIHSHSARRLLSFHWIVLLLGLITLAALGWTHWTIRQSTASYVAKSRLVVEQVHLPYRASLLLAEASGEEERAHLAALWVEGWEALQKGDARRGFVNETSEAEAQLFAAADPALREMIKSLRAAETVEAGLAPAQIREKRQAWENALLQYQALLANSHQNTMSWLSTFHYLLLFMLGPVFFLESFLIMKPLLSFLSEYAHRRGVIQEAQRSHQQVVRDLKMQVPHNTETAPALGKKAHEEDKLESLLSDQYPAKIMVVEDHPANQKYVMKLFQKAGYEVALASNGREALEKALEERFDLIFMDIQMPIMDGIQASYEILRQLPVSEQPVIIAFTGSAEPEIQEQCLEVGMKDIIWKPVKREQVVESIIKWAPRQPVA